MLADPTLHMFSQLQLLNDNVNIMLRVVFYDLVFFRYLLLSDYIVLIYQTIKIHSCCVYLDTVNQNKKIQFNYIYKKKFVYNDHKMMSIVARVIVVQSYLVLLKKILNLMPL